MKKFLAYVKMFFLGFCSIILLTNIVSNASAMPIEVLSSDYHIWGIISGKIYPLYGVHELISESYDFYSSQPISHYVTFEEEYPGTYFWATSSGEAFHTNVESSSHSYGEIFLGGPNAAYADSTWVFKTPSNQVNIDFDWSYSQQRSLCYAFGEIWLEDLTAGTELFYLKAGPPGGITLDGHYTLDLDLDPTHLYSLRTYSQATSGDDSIGYDINAAFSVPEPSTILLMGAGIVGLAFARKKLKK